MYDSAKDTTTVLKVLSLRDTENEMINIMKKKKEVLQGGSQLERQEAFTMSVTMKLTDQFQRKKEKKNLKALRLFLIFPYPPCLWASKPRT